MKRFILLIGLVLIFVFAIFSVAYLITPTQITVDLDNLQAVKQKEATLFIKGNWGKKSAQFGITKGGWLPGPMSLAADGQENLYILDQENRRVQVFSQDGKIESIPIDNSTYEDIALDDAGLIYLLDPVENHLVRKFDQSGKVIRTYDIAEEIQPISALILANNQVYVEVEHKKVYRIGSETKVLNNETSQLQTESEGQPTDEGFKTEAELDDKGQVTADIAGRYPLDAIKITGSSNIYQIISLDSDANKNLHLTLNIAKNDSDFNQQKDKLLGLIFSSEGNLSAKLYASNQYYTSHFRKFAVSPNGVVYQLQTTAEGVVVWKWH